jgi:Dolichyl-phosphate-mannose-protein mannosyltransferase
MASLGFALAHLLPAAGLALLAVALGRRIAILACPELGEGRWGLPLAAGLGTLACAASLLAAAGVLIRPALLSLLATAAALAAPMWRPLAGEVVATLRGRRGSRWRLAVLAAALPGALLALYPPTGFDALLYHLPAAARFATSGQLSVTPELRFPAFPWLNEVLFAAAMRLQDDVQAQCLEWVAWAGTAALLWEGCSRRFGRWAGAVAACLWLGDPLASWLAASAYVEPLVALFLLATVEALDTAGRAGSPRALLVAGGLAGCAAATKYQGLLAVGLVGVVSAWSAWGAWGARQTAAAAPVPRLTSAETGRQDPGALLSRLRSGTPLARRLATAVAPLAVAAIVALPWYVWVGAVTGNPLFPLLTRGHLGTAASPGPGSGWTMALERPWGEIRRVLWPYPPGSPLLWLLWPLPLLAWRRAPAAGRLAAVSLAMALIVAAFRPDPRLLSAFAPLAAAAIAVALAVWAAARWGEAAAGPRLLALSLAAVLPGWCYTAHLVAQRGPVPAGTKARDTYLRRQLPGYGALSWLNSTFAGRYTVYGLAAENLRYYAAGRFLGDWFGPAGFAEVMRLAGRPSELHAFLAPLGVDHLLVRRIAGELDLAGPWFRAEYRDDEAAVWALTAPRGGPAAALPREGT